MNLKLGLDKEIQINMLDQKRNNLYSYISDILLFGKKVFEIDPSNPENFLIITSVKLRDDITD